MKKIRLAILCLSLSLIVFTLSACNQEKSGIPALEEAVKKVFSLPTTFATEHLDEFLVLDSAKELEQPYGDFVQEMLPKEAFSEEYLEDFSHKTFLLLGIDLYCSMNDISMTPTSVKIEQELEKSKIYTFTAECKVKTADKETVLVFEGKIQLDENDKITYFECTNDPLKLLMDFVEAS